MKKVYGIGYTVHEREYFDLKNNIGTESFLMIK